MAQQEGGGPGCLAGWVDRAGRTGGRGGGVLDGAACQDEEGRPLGVAVAAAQRLPCLLAGSCPPPPAPGRHGGTHDVPVRPSPCGAPRRRCLMQGGSRRPPLQIRTAAKNKNPVRGHRHRQPQRTAAALASAPARRRAGAPRMGRRAATTRPTRWCTCLAASGRCSRTWRCCWWVGRGQGTQGSGFRVLRGQACWVW